MTPMTPETPGPVIDPIIGPVIGVDFSGAKQDSSTWMATGVLTPNGLHVNDIRSLTRADLLDALRSAAAGPQPSVASLDFPFSVPQPFAQVLAGNPRHMADVWAAVADMTMEHFIALRDDFVIEHGELRRDCDLSHGEAFSVLHKANPNMLPMTLRGMQLLHHLQAPGIRILCQDPPGPARLTILECMPGATLKGLGLPYKAYKNGRRRDELRHRILDGLTRASPVPLANPGEIAHQCLTTHDALDAVVAALTSAAYITNPHSISTPPLTPIHQLEGWIYHIQPPPP